MLLFGGQSLEHEVSLQSAMAVWKNVDVKKYRMIPVYIDKKGNWFFYDGVKDTLPTILPKDLVKIENVIAELKKVDIVFPMIHGAFGEDGRLQGFLEHFGIPYVGCDAKTSMLCMDKEYMKILAIHAGIPILPTLLLTKEKIKEVNDFPVIVKPASGGSSIGIGIAKDRRELAKRYREALVCDTKVIAEKFADVRELEVGLLTKKGRPIFSPIGEILKEGEYYSYERKYINSEKVTTSPTLSKELEERIYQLALKVTTLFHLKGFARIDFFYEPDTDELYFNEVNTIPGFTEISMYPLLFQKKMTYQKLLSSILESL